MTPFRIEWNFAGASAFTLTQRRLFFDGAAQRWSDIVRGWPPLPNGSPVTINDGTPLRFLRVFVEIAMLKDREAFARVETDEASLSRLGADMGRAARLPYQGTLRINRRDLEKRETEPARFKDSIVHELGHLLGIGTVFHAKGLVSQSAGGDFFVGKAAMHAYARLLGRHSGTEKIPLVSEPEGSTRAYHWSEQHLQWEIMSDQLDSEAATRSTVEFNAISAVTVGALEDLGYEVDMRHAEPYALRPGRDADSGEAVRAAARN